MGDQMSDGIESFRVRVDDAQLEDHRSRLARTRFPDQIPGTEWEAGIPIAYLRELIDYWIERYDWRQEEARLNEFAQFRTRIDGQSIHFIHVRSPHEDALPLLLSHGWPGSIVEFLAVIPRLTDPPAYGGRAADAFHVVAPSLPGYGFSEPPRTRGWDVRRIAEAFIVLMHRLDYGRYGAQGGDWGAQVTARIGALDPEHCAAIHLNMPIGVRVARNPVRSPMRSSRTSATCDTSRARRPDTPTSRGPSPRPWVSPSTTRPPGSWPGSWRSSGAWSDCDGHPENVLHPQPAP